MQLSAKAGMIAGAKIGGAGYPIVGNIAGAIVGALVGIAINAIAESDAFNGKSVKDLLGDLLDDAINGVKSWFK